MTPRVIKTWRKKLKSANKSLKHLMTAHHKERAFQHFCSARSLMNHCCLKQISSQCIQHTFKHPEEMSEDHRRVQRLCNRKRFIPLVTFDSYWLFAVVLSTKEQVASGAGSCSVKQSQTFHKQQDWYCCCCFSIWNINTAEIQKHVDTV